MNLKKTVVASLTSTSHQTGRGMVFDIPFSPCFLSGEGDSRVNALMNAQVITSFIPGMGGRGFLHVSPAAKNVSGKKSFTALLKINCITVPFIKYSTYF